MIVSLIVEDPRDRRLKVKLIGDVTVDGGEIALLFDKRALPLKLTLYMRPAEALYKDDRPAEEQIVAPLPSVKRRKKK